MRRFTAILIVLFVPLLTSCATTPAHAYPPFDGRWLYDYAASVGDDATLPPDFAESISRLDREGRNEDHKRLESIAMKLRPPEIISIEYVATTMAIRGGGAFERNYELSNLNPTPGIEVKWDMVTLEAKLTDGLIEVTEHYELAPGGSQLLISITINAPNLEKPLEMRRVYLSSRAF